MGKRLRYPVGIQTFSEIIEEGYFYVDKTELIYDLVSDNKYVFLSRPRRFGKSLLMSTLYEYFRGRKELFKGLAIESLEKNWETYPVFRFDLSPTNFNHPSRLISLITRYLNNIQETYELTSDSDVISDRFADLLRCAYLKYGKKAVILIDEYDKPMLDCLDDPGLHEKLKAELRGFYSVIKASDEYIHFAMLTGITRFGKVSIFSGLNNLKDISMLAKFNSLCGITESEFHRDFPESIRAFAEAEDISEEEAWREFKTMYDGYRFARKGEYIYNPYSVLSAFDNEEIKGFWYSSGSTNFLVKLVSTHEYALDNIEGERRTEAELGDITDMENDFIPLLYQAGYLTLKDYDPSDKRYTLGFPNLEVREAFWESLVSHFFRIKGRSVFNLRQFTDDVIKGDPEGFMVRLRSLFADISSETEPDKEIHFQNMMAVVAKMMGFTVRTEIHSSAGRCDMQILTPSYVYIFEFKIDGSAEDALRQILDRGYHLPFGADTRTLFLIGADFSRKTRTLTAWQIQTLPRNKATVIRQ